MRIRRIIGTTIAAAVLAATVGCASIDTPVSEPVKDPLVECDSIANDGLFFYLEGNHGNNLDYLHASLNYFECAKGCYNNEGVFDYDDFIENYWMNIVQGDINFLEGNYNRALGFYLGALRENMNTEILKKLRVTQSLRSDVKKETEELSEQEVIWGSIKALYR